MTEDIGEFDLISRYLKPLVALPGALALTDDAATIKVPASKQLIMSKDVLVGNVHFFENDLPDLIARKALRTNISDIIAKGAHPYCYALGLCFPGQASEDFIASFAEGLAADQDIYGVSLIGGDTTRSISDLMISVTMFGLAGKRGAVTRLGAGPGEAVYVSGTLGGSAVGLQTLLDRPRFEGLSEVLVSDLQSEYLLPQPPFGLQKMIAAHASASMDISDGLFQDAGHLARASEVTIIIEQEQIPMSTALQLALESDPDLLETALKGGDDYQCLMTIPPDHQALFESDCADAGIMVSLIGKTIARARLPVMLRHHGEVVENLPTGYTHF
ncbi:MAG: thiamine-phosphate kinase [Rhizobiales bacterium]|nr:thiamine-phosphate kinase [Hyphomicrobiales bacterium]